VVHPDTFCKEKKEKESSHFHKPSTKSSKFKAKKKGDIQIPTLPKVCVLSVTEWSYEPRPFIIMHCDRLRDIFISHDSVRITCCVPNYTDDFALNPSQTSAVFFVLLPDQKDTRNNNKKTVIRSVYVRWH
jgi:hypothetical protein